MGITAPVKKVCLTNNNLLEEKSLGCSIRCHSLARDSHFLTCYAYAPFVGSPLFILTMVDGF